MELIVPQLYKFFDKVEGGKIGQNLFDFIKTREECFFKDKYGETNMNVSQANYLSTICKKMVEDGLLINLNPSSNSPTTDKYFVHLRPKNFKYPELFEQQLAYGYYDFAYNGLPFIREHFLESVVSIVGINKKGDNDIGTAYYIGDNMFVTARHCVLDLSQFTLQYQNGNQIRVSEVLFTDDKSIDLAIIKADEEIRLTPFMLGEPNVLDDVLVMGYPPIPGMDSVLISETGSISTFIPPAQKASAGQVVAETKSYLPPMDYFMINCRVKGGNSGGPVINEHGLVIGTVVSLVYDSQGGSDGGRYDIMGFGTCLSSKYICNVQQDGVTQEVELNDGYYSILK